MNDFKSALSRVGAVLLVAVLTRTAGARPSSPHFVPDELLVQARPGASLQAALKHRIGVRDLRDVSPGAPGLSLIRLHTGTDLDQATAALRREPGVEFVQPNYIAHNFTTRPRAHGFSTAPEETSGPLSAKPPLLPRPPEVAPPVADPELETVYGLRITRTTEAWRTWSGREGTQRGRSSWSSPRVTQSPCLLYRAAARHWRTTAGRSDGPGIAPAALAYASTNVVLYGWSVKARRT